MNDPLPASSYLTKPDCLLRPNEAARQLGVSLSCLEAWRYRGGGPRFVRISARCVRYRRVDLEQWIRERVRSSTSEPVHVDR
jgi:predicted DNA-binding transcriptional regulator AlpA